MVSPVMMGDISTTCPITMAWGVKSIPRPPSGPSLGQSDKYQQAHEDRGHTVEGLDHVYQRSLAREGVEVDQASDGNEHEGRNQRGSPGDQERPARYAEYLPVSGKDELEGREEAVQHQVHEVKGLPGTMEEV